MTESSDQRLLSILRAEGPLSPASLMSRLNLSQPTLFRSAKAQSKTIVSLGAPRNRKLAALRNVRTMGSSTPLFLVSTEGEVTSIGQMLSIYPTSFVIIMNSNPSKPIYYPGLPYFLDDLRPQGFLGKSFGQKHLDLKLPPRILDWNSNDVLEAIANRGEDLVGNILVGAESFERFQSLCKRRIEASETIEAENPRKSYVQYAQAAIDGEPAGSSLGGEQPKFCAVLLNTGGVYRRIIVKFSPKGDTFSARRWRDLLICESLSLEVLRSHGILAAEGRILEAGGRTFLETNRFDRVGLHGRKGMLSLAALENGWMGHGSNWAISASLLERQNKISKEDLKTIQKLECFGRLIANSDRHPGNLSFYWQPGEDKARLAPVYDMLPMLYAPSSGGEDTARIFTLPTYDHTLLDAWKDSVSLAIQFWKKVVEDLRVSQEFRNIAGQNILVLKPSLREHGL